MRIAILNWSRRKAGGIETYLGAVMPALVHAGHELAFWHEVDLPRNRERIVLPERTPAWSVEESDAASALGKLRAWRPDLLYTHSLLDPAIERQTLSVAPAVFFGHAYYGTCISGEKTFKNPIITPCHRRFGWQCLLHYYPHRCGGWSPVTMLHEYWRQSERLELLFRYRAIVTHSAYMREEYVRHGLRHTVYHLPYESESHSPVSFHRRLPSTVSLATAETLNHEQPWRLLFVGRMDRLKGGRTLLDALPEVLEFLERPLRVTFAGDGPDRQAWERQASRLSARRPELNIRFVGWVASHEIGAFFDAADLLILPSLWPEPFALVGMEAGRHRLPVAAFAVGGIPEWLHPGENGHLAPGDPPTASGLAQAIAACLDDRDHHMCLREGAAAVADRLSMNFHVAALLKVFEDVVRT